MKVKVEIEFEMERETEESEIAKTKEELLSGITITDSDDVDGFVVTTDFADCDNTEDFFIKPCSAKIIAVESSEFSLDELSVVDIEINADFTGVSSYIETYFDVDKKFGTDINDDCDSWLNFYAEYFPESKELKCEYYVHTPTKEENHSYVPTEKEKQLIVFAMEEFCQDNYGENILEFIQSEQEGSESEKLTLGSM